MLIFLIILAVLIVLSPFAAVPLFRHADTNAEDDAPANLPKRATFIEETH